MATRFPVPETLLDHVIFLPKRGKRFCRIRLHCISVEGDDIDLGNNGKEVGQEERRHKNQELTTKELEELDKMQEGTGPRVSNEKRCNNKVLVYYFYNKVYNFVTMSKIKHLCAKH